MTSYIFVVPASDYRAVGQILYMTDRIPHEIELNFSVVAKAIVSFRVVDTARDVIVVPAHSFNQNRPDEMCAVTLTIDRGAVPDTDTICEIQARTLGGELRIYHIGIRPERSVVDRLAELVP